MTARLARVPGSFGCVAFAIAMGPTPAHAEPCTGAEPLELVSGCSVVGANQDFEIALRAAPAVDRTNPQWIRNALNRTLIFVQGYGVASTALPEVLYEDGTAGALEGLQAEGISVVVMAPCTSKQDRVEDDARALRSALELLGAYRGDSALPWVLFGHSMGGLVGRIALAGIEAEGASHDVALYVSYDAPHSGVNVPQGMQNLKVKLDEWAAMTEADFVAIDPGWEGVFDLAAMTGMTTALDPDSVRGFPDPTSLQAQQMTLQPVALPAERAAFVTLLSAVGFPAVRKIAVTNGNTLGIGHTQAVGPGGELFYFTGAKGNSAASVRGTFEVFTDSPGAACFRSDVYYDGLFQNHDGGRKDASTPADILPYDHLSGGSLDYAAEMLAAAYAAAADFHEPSFRGASDSAIPFVPTASALALPVSTPDADLAGIIAGDGTPFDRVFAIGDLPAFPSNLDHNTLVMPDALRQEITLVLTCRLTLPGRESDPDGDGVDDACDTDDDDDDLLDPDDDCPLAANGDQLDTDTDGEGDACDTDDDGDGFEDPADNCPSTANEDQRDADSDGEGDVCDATPDPEPFDGASPSYGCSAAKAPGPPSTGILLAMLAVRLLRTRGRGRLAGVSQR